MAEQKASDWRVLITETLARRWPEIPGGWRWIEAQLATESGGDPRAESPVGALGLMQLMPATAAELGVLNPFDPAQNIDAGVRYLRIQYEHLGEIPVPHDRLFWALAAYNGGRGYVNKALSLARRDGIKDWWRWEVGSWYLHHRDCLVGSRFPDYMQIRNYVARIAGLAEGGRF